MNNTCLSTSPSVILLVEDDACVRTFITGVLRRKCFSVIEAENASSALDISRSFHGDIKLLLTDIDMPGMDGTALSKMIVAERSGIRVLQMSGGCQIDSLLGGSAVPFLQKPFQVNALMSKIEEVMR